MRKIANLFLLLGLMLFVSYGFAYAQQTTQTQSVSPYGSGALNFLMERENEQGINYGAVFEQLPEDIQADLIEEVTQEYQKCSRKATLSKYYNCKCVAIAYLDERIKQGPEPHNQNLFQQVLTQCPYPEGVAGISYVKCENMMAMSVVGNLEKFCTCFANHVSAKFTEYPSQHSEYISLLHRQAMGECGYRQELEKYRRLKEEREIYK